MQGQGCAHQARVLCSQLVERLARAAPRRQHLPQRRLHSTPVMSWAGMSHSMSSHV